MTGGKAIHAHAQRSAQALAIPQHLHVDIIFVLVIAQFRIAQAMNMGQLA